MTIPRTALLALSLLLAACGGGEPETAPAAPDPTVAAAMDSVAEAYVKLVLAVGQHDPAYVDAYYGPPEWRAAADSATVPLAEIESRAGALRARLGEIPAEGFDELSTLRHTFLDKQLRAMQARLDFLGGERLSFDEESRALYDAVAPTRDEAYFERLLLRLDSVLPGEGPVAARYERFRDDFIIPTERLDTVFRAAIEACRSRTAPHVQLPPEESFTVEYVTDKPWSGYNWYQGGFQSLIQVNTDLPISIDRAIDLACHEGYPGHHVYNALLEKNLVRDRGWVEFSVYPLFSPMSLVAEGSANYGIDVAFPGDERAEFEREVLFPLAGLDPARAEEFYRVFDLTGELSYAGNEAARRYLDGEIDADSAAAWLNRYALMEPARARQRVDFIDTYRSYVINYNLGKDLVREYVESRAGDDPARRWEVFTELLSSPRLASSLTAGGG